MDKNKEWDKLTTQEQINEIIEERIRRDKYISFNLIFNMINLLSIFILLGLIGLTYDFVDHLGFMLNIGIPFSLIIVFCLVWNFIILLIDFIKNFKEDWRK